MIFLSWILQPELLVIIAIIIAYFSIVKCRNKEVVICLCIASLLLFILGVVIKGKSISNNDSNTKNIDYVHYIGNDTEVKDYEALG